MHTWRMHIFVILTSQLLHVTALILFFWYLCFSPYKFVHLHGIVFEYPTGFISLTVDGFLLVIA